MHILITRPKEDSAALAEMLRRHGITPVIEPMMTIVPSEEVPVLAGVQAILLTSANGADALAEKTSERDVPVFAVGDASARAARRAGFESVEAAAGDVTALAALVGDRLDPGAGTLLHPAGSVVAGDLAGKLEKQGFMVRRAVLYEARTALEISPPTCRLLAEGAIDAALFFSPRTAQTFVILVNQANLGAACANVAAVCLSAAVATALRGVEWREVRVARRPETDALLGELDAWMSQLKPEC